MARHINNSSVSEQNAEANKKQHCKICGRPASLTHVSGLYQSEVCCSSDKTPFVCDTQQCIAMAFRHHFTFVTDIHKAFVRHFDNVNGAY